MTTIFDKKIVKKRSGQSLMELLIGMAVGGLLIIGTTLIISSSIQTAGQVSNVQVETQLSQELLNNTKSFASGNWNSLLSLATGTANDYYLNVSSSPFSAVVATGTAQAVTDNGATYQRYFYVNDVYRDSSGNVTSTTSGNFYDPSTKQITVVVTMPSSTAPLSFSEYVTRNNGTNVFTQSNWSGGKKTTAATFVSSTYANATNTVINTAADIQLATSSGHGGGVVGGGSGTSSVSVLVVAGGGGGAGYYGGGGGAGGVLYDASHAITSGNTYTVTVGAGGSGSNTAGTGQTSGANSVFDTDTGIGGGFGGSAAGVNAAPGGSGGGGGEYGKAASGTVGQGYAGGKGSYPGFAGGGGAGGAALNANSTGTVGGIGVSYSISGSSVYYGGGGGGGAYGSDAAGAGGLGGGGAGKNNGGSGTAGTANTGGGGGGGGGGATGGAGGSGIVIISAPTSAGITATGGTHTTSGGNDIWTFTSGGTWTPSFGGGSSGPTQVQKVEVNNFAYAAGQTVTLPQATVAGDMIIVAYYNAARADSNPDGIATDTVNGTYLVATSTSDFDNKSFTAIDYMPNAASVSSVGISVQDNYTSWGAVIYEYSGLSTSTPLDQVAADPGVTYGPVTSWSDPLTGTASGDLLVGVGAAPDTMILNTSTFKSDWAPNSSTNLGPIFASGIASGTGSFPYQGTSSDNGRVDISAASFFTPGTAGPATGTIDSEPLDTGSASGTQLNSFTWQGTQPAGTTISFQFAVSNASSGPWNYFGPDGTSNTYFSGTAGTPISLFSTTNGYSLFNGYRYFSDRILLYTSSTVSTPTVTGVSVNWSP